MRVITLNDDEALIAKPIVAELRANMVRVAPDFSATPFNSDESRARTKTPTRSCCSVEPVARCIGAQRRRTVMLVIGGSDMEAGAVSERLHHGRPQNAKPKVEVISEILASIKERSA